MAYVKKQLPKDIKQSAVICAINGSVLLVIISRKKTYRNVQSSEISWLCMPCLKKELPSILSPVNILKRFLGMHQLLFCPWLKIKVLLKMLTNFFKKNLKTYLTLKKKFTLFHVNISSLPYHFQDLNDLLKSLKKNSSIIGITEGRCKVNSQPLI